MPESPTSNGRNRCPTCAEGASAADAFCRRCGSRVGQGESAAGAARMPGTAKGEDRARPSASYGVASGHAAALAAGIPEPVRRLARDALSRLGGLGGDGPGRDAVRGLALGFGCAAVLVAATYAVLLLRGTLDDPSVPWDVGLLAFALLHGGSAFVEVGPVAGLLGLTGSAEIGLPVTSFAVAPFFLTFLGTLLLSRGAGPAGLFAVAVALSYATAVALSAVVGGVSVETPDAPFRLYAGPLSAAAWGSVLAAAGAAAGRASLRGTRARGILRGVTGRAERLDRASAGRAGRACRGALVAVAAGMLPTFFFSVLDVATCGLDVPLGNPCDGRGVVLLLLPTITGGAWLLGHGLPVGFDNNTDFGGLPLVGSSLSDLPTQVSLFGDWPLGWEYRLLAAAPVLGILLGGLLAARGVPRRERFLQGALVCLPYVAVTVLVNALVGVSVEAVVAETDLRFVLRVPLVWILALLLGVGVLSGLGGLLSGNARFAALASRFTPSRFRSG